MCMAKKLPQDPNKKYGIEVDEVSRTNKLVRYRKIIHPGAILNNDDCTPPEYAVDMIISGKLLFTGTDINKGELGQYETILRKPGEHYIYSNETIEDLVIMTFHFLGEKDEDNTSE